MASKSIDIIISTVLKKTGIDAARTAIKNLASSVGRNLMNIKAGFDMASAAVRTFVSALSTGIRFENLTTQFKTLLGSLEDAKRHMADLQDLGRTPPFSLEAFSAASREMMKLTGGVLGFRQELEMVGDIAAATGSDITSVSHAVGLAYQMIRDGQPFGRAATQLVHLGVLTKAQVEDFNEMTKSGEDNIVIWEKLVGILKNYEGAMAETEKTTGGVIEAIKGEATVAMTNFSKALSDAASPALSEFLSWLREINENGSIEEWANTTVGKIREIGDAARYSASLLAKVGNGLWKGFKSSVGVVMSFADGAEQAFSEGASFTEQLKAGAAVAKEFWRETWEDEEELAEAATEKREERIKETATKEQQAAEHTAKIVEDMEQAKWERERKAREELERKAEEDMKKAAEREIAEKKKKLKAEEEAYQRLMKDRADMEKRAADEMERGIYRKKMDDLQKRHKAEMDALDKQQRKAEDAVEKLKARGAEHPFQMASGLNQAAEIRASRQEARDERRFEIARAKLSARMKEADITDINDPSQVGKLGRLSNLDAAVLARMQLDSQKDKLKDIEERKLSEAKKTNEKLDDLTKQLSAIGL